MAIPDPLDLNQLPLAEPELLSHIFNTPQLGITIYSPARGWIEANDTFCNMLGYTREELFQCSFRDITHEDDVRDDRELYRRLLAGELEHYSIQKRYLRKDGGILYAHVSIDSIRDHRGEVNNVIAFVRDISRQHDVELALSESENRYRMMAETSGEWIWEITSDSRYIYTNPMVGTILGYSIQEVLGAHVFTFMEQQDGKYFQERFRECLDKKCGWRGLEFRWRHKNGDIRVLESNATPIINEQGRVIGLRGSDRDITGRKTVEDALRNRSMQQSVIARVGHFAIQHSDINSLMELIVNKLASTLNLEYTKILEYFPETNDLLLCAGVGWSPGLIGSARVSADRGSQAGYTLTVNQHIIVEDLAADSRFSGPALLIDHGVISGMSVMIAGQDRPWGVLGVHSRQRRHFTSEDTDFLHSMANILADAIQRYGVDTEIRRYKDIVDTSDDAIGFIDRDYRYQTVNRELLRIVNRDKAEIIGHHVAEILGEEYFDREVKGLIDRCLAGEKIRLQSEYSMGGPEALYLDIQYNPYYDRNGQISGAAFFSRDVSIRKRLERESEFYRYIADSTEDIMAFVDKDYIYRSVNRKFLEVFNKTKEEVIGRSIEQAFGRQAFLNVKADYDRCLQGESFHIQRWTKLPVILGTCMHRVFSPYRDPDGRVTGVVVSSRDITESKRIEDQLREYQRVIQTLMDNLPGMIYRSLNDRHRTMELVSRRIQELTGRPAQEFLTGKVHWADIVHQDDRAHIRWSMEAALENRRTYEIEYRIMHAGGDLRWVREQGSGVFDDSGAVIAMEGYITDITEYRHYQEEIRRYRDIVETTGDLIAYVDTNYIYRAVNQPYLDFAGRTREQVLGHSVAEILGSDYFNNIARSNIDKCLAGEFIHVQRWFDMADGRRAFEDVNLTPYRDDKGTVRGIVFSGRDITGRKLMEEALEKTAAQLREAQQIAHMGFWEFNVQENRHAWSDEVYSIYGVDPRNFIPSHGSIGGLIHPDDRPWVERERDRAMASQDRLGYEYRIIRPDNGEVRYIHVIGEIRRDDARRVTRVFGTVLDTTERKQAEEKLNRSRERLRNLVVRLQAVREEERTLIAREIHDELGQGLTALKIDLSLMKSRLPANWKKLPEHLQKMINDIDSTIDYVRKLSSSLRPPILDDLGLDAAIEWQIQGFATRTQCDYALDIQPSPFEYDYDRETAVFRIFQEALNNVARHANAGQVGVTLNYSGRVMTMKLTDDGVGIPAAKINDPHSIGLIGMHERAAMFGGTVEINNMVSGGTCVTLTLPFPGPEA